jgi:CobQ-like glutamine amidotransferase family enzyme
MSTLTIVQLYPDELGVAGDAGNVLALAERARRADVEVMVVDHNVGDELPVNADVVVVGNGPLSAMRKVHADLQHNAARIRAWVESGVQVLAYGAGAELLGSRIITADEKMDGLGIFPLTAHRGGARVVGYILSESVHGPIVGFEDHASRWEMADGSTPFGTVTAGGGNGDGSEGVVVDTAIATQIGGPVLPLNPGLTDALLGAALKRRGIDYVPTDRHATLDRYAREARAVISKHAEHHFKRI